MPSPYVHEKSRKARDFSERTAERGDVWRGSHMRNGTRVALLAAVACATLLTGCTRPGSADTAAVADQVRKDATELVADYNAQNAAAAAAWDAPDYIGVFHGTPNVNGPAADEAGMNAAMAATKVLWQIGEPKVTVSKAG